MVCLTVHSVGILVKKNLKKNPLLLSVPWTITVTNYYMLYYHHHDQQQQKQHLIVTSIYSVENCAS
jgi:hypothetical protein